MALRVVHEAWRALKAPIVGVGGIMDEGDVMEFLVAGASAVQVGTANFSDPMIIPKLVERVKAIVTDSDMQNIGAFVGMLDY